MSKLEAELREAKQAEGIEEDEDEITTVFYPVSEQDTEMVFTVIEDGLHLTHSSKRFLIQTPHDGLIPITGTKAVHDKVKEVFAQLEKARAAEKANSPHSNPPPEGEGTQRDPFAVDDKRIVTTYQISNGLKGKEFVENVQNAINQEWKAASDSPVVQYDLPRDSMVVATREFDLKKLTELIKTVEKSMMEEPTLITYPLTKDTTVTKYIVQFLLGQSITDKRRVDRSTRVAVDVIEKSKTLIVLGYKADHENVETVLSKVPLGEEAVVNIKGKEYIIDLYPLSALAEDVEDISMLCDFIRAGVPGVMILPVNQPHRFLIMGDRAEHAKVKLLLEQMEKVKQADTPADVPQEKLELKLDGPHQVTVGTTASYQLVVTNRGTKAIENVKLSMTTWDGALKPVAVEGGKAEIQERRNEHVVSFGGLAPIPPGESVTIKVECTALQQMEAAQIHFRVAAGTNGGYTETIQHQVRVVRPS
ncbi:MAG: hypothetical protein LBI05_08010 [Planctomycetaceae bacterium]|nr:hypothetical protein [Planctomycetaceae bacterium]